ncbi:MAG: hypothetical protein IJS25_03120 [Bacteroidales bacterium]|nr:hypothetical protein [Bacteroidales bacterium]
MKRILTVLSACLLLIACNQTGRQNNITAGNADAQVSADKPMNEKETYLSAICRYMTEIGTEYAQGEYCIPYFLIVAADTASRDDIRVWGDFWVENYNLSGDTLKTVSGGSHPGCMHVKKTGDKYAVTQFDAVGDGSAFTSTAKAIFGDHYDALIALSANDDAKKAARTKSIIDYASANDLRVSCYQDFGWPAVKLAQ